jgi:hypothetical protein
MFRPGRDYLFTRELSRSLCDFNSLCEASRFGIGRSQEAQDSRARSARKIDGIFSQLDRLGAIANRTDV